MKERAKAKQAYISLPNEEQSADLLMYKYKTTAMLDKTKNYKSKKLHNRDLPWVVSAGK